MKLNVFDTYLVIKDTENAADMTDALLEKFDEMLTAAGVDHAFTECGDNDFDKYAGAYCRVFYNESDDTKFSLTYLLFSSAHRGVSDELINKAMAKHLAKKW